MSTVTAAADVPAGTAAHDPRTLRLLQAPVLATLLRLAAPNIGEAAARVAFISFDAIFVSWLGTEALAGIALVFPIFLIVQMVSAGGYGAGVAGAIARALGAGDRAVAARIAGQGLTVAIGGAAIVGGVMLIFGAPLYRLMGAEGAALSEALTYSGIVFGGGLLVWLMNISANILRGCGSMAVAAGAIVAGEVAHLVISPALILGWGPLPQLGIAGAAIGILSAYGVGALILLGWIATGRALVRLRPADLMPDFGAMRPILGIGSLTALNVLQFQIATVVLSGFIGSYGATTLAGLGAAMRLELLQIPIIFAFGSAVIALTATNAGAGRLDRVRQAAWCGGLVAAAISTVFAAVALLAPERWMGAMSADPAVIAAGREYLVTVGASYPLLGLALGLFFASLGIGRVLPAFLVGLVRVAIVVIGGGLLLAFARPEPWLLYLVVADAFAVFGLAMAWLTWRGFRRHS